MIDIGSGCYHGKPFAADGESTGKNSLSWSEHPTQKKLGIRSRRHNELISVASPWTKCRN